MFAAAFAASPATAHEVTADDDISARIAVAMTGYDRFQTTRSLDDLRKTEFELIKVVRQRDMTTGDVVGHRRSIVAAYAKVIHAAESMMDPNFDPTELAQNCVTPPREPGRGQAPACSAPNDIRDPDIRAKYIAAIEANTARTRYLNGQRAILSVATEGASLLGIVLHRFDEKHAPGDRATIDEILRKSGVSKARWKEIYAPF